MEDIVLSLVEKVKVLEEKLGEKETLYVCTKHSLIFIE